MRRGNKQVMWRCYNDAACGSHMCRLYVLTSELCERMLVVWLCNRVAVRLSYGGLYVISHGWLAVGL